MVLLFARHGIKHEFLAFVLQSVNSDSFKDKLQSFSIALKPSDSMLFCVLWETKAFQWADNADSP